jgi:hypothetical protein
MTRISNADFLRAANAQETGVFPILLLTITDPSLTEDIRISTDATQRVEETATAVVYGTISNGETFYFIPLAIKLPDDVDEGPQSMTVQIDNVSRELVAVVRGLTTPPSVNVDIVLSSDTNTVVGSWPEFLLTNIRTDAQTISGELVLEILINEPFPAGTFNPSEFPGCF